MSTYGIDKDLIEAATKILLGEEDKKVSDYPHAHHYLHGAYHYTDSGNSHSAVGKKPVPKEHQKAMEYIENKFKGKSKTEIHGHGKHYAYHGGDREINRHPSHVDDSLDKL